jgi:hypothetical protein
MGPAILDHRTEEANFVIPVKGYGVGEYAKFLDGILSGSSDANFRFPDLVQLLLHLGFDERTRSDCSVFTRNDVEEILHLQPRGSMARPYQVKQVRNVILRYRLGADKDG